jgi:spermidine/putrescine transport system permease protein
MGRLILFNAMSIAKSLLAAGIGHAVINLPLCFAIAYSQMGDHQLNAEYQRYRRTVCRAVWPSLSRVSYGPPPRPGCG